MRALTHLLLAKPRLHETRDGHLDRTAIWTIIVLTALFWLCVGALLAALL